MNTLNNTLYIITNAQRSIHRIGTRADILTAAQTIATTVDSPMMLPARYFLKDCILLVQPTAFFTHTR